MKELYEGIFEDVQCLPVVDTHEHLPHCDADRDKNTDVLKEYLIHYMSSDIISAGMKRSDLGKVTDPSKPILERWEMVEAYWEVSRYTGYGRALDISAKKIHGVDGINKETIETLNDSFMESLAPGQFHRVLKDMCGIHISLLDGFTGRFECDRDLFRRVWRLDHFIMPGSYAGQVIQRMESRYTLNIHTLDDWMEASDRELKDALSNGIVALKCGLAYQRSLRFEKVDYKAAYEAFDKAVGIWEKNGRKADKELAFSIEVQDFMMHHILHAANEKHLTFQFHTGLQEGNGNILSNSDPSLMTNLFLEYPDVNFDLFHISYPFQGIASALCKNFANVFIDMCWAHIISPSASMHALDDFLDAVPYNKISAFGGDYGFIDGVYGHLYLARQNVSCVLTQKVKHKVFSLEKAMDIAHALFYDNPLRIFQLTDV